MALDRRFSDTAPINADYPAALLATLREANARLWWRDLLREACNAVADPHLLAFAQDVAWGADVVAADRETSEGADAPRRVGGANLEAKIREAGATFDVLAWRAKLAAIEGCICRIELPAGQARGTGFLVGPDAVLTNYHVVQDVCRNLLSPDALVARFDYKVLRDGVSVAAGRPVCLHPDWLIDHSRYSAADFDPHPDGAAPADELDYALLRLSARVGDDVVEGAPRGWIPVPQAPLAFTPMSALYIVQHPDGKPMQVALDTQAVVAASATRVQYTTTTEPGSSGSPCFSSGWDWVALHQLGDPQYYRDGIAPKYNQGIPVPAIVDLLRRRGKLGMIGA